MADSQPMESQRVSPTPKSDLDYSMMTTDPAWGQSFIPKELKTRLSEEFSEEKTVIDIQVIAKDTIDKNITSLISDGFTKISDNRLERRSDVQYIGIDINRETGEFKSTIINKTIVTQGYWEILGYYTRDLRLGNLDDGSNPFKPNEVAYCEYHLNLAGDELNTHHPDLPHGFHKAFFAHIRRVASKIEISHSKHGWFRKQGGTVRSEVKYEGVPPDQNAKKMLGMMMPGNKQQG